MKPRKPGETYMMVCAGLSAILWLVSLLKMDFFWFIPNSMSPIGAIFVLTIFGFHLMGTYVLICFPIFWFQKQLKRRQQSNEENRDV